MAKKRDFEAEHFNNVEEFTKQIRLLYYAAIREAVRMGVQVNFDPKKPFTFSQFPALNTRVKDLFTNLSGKMLKTINDGTQHEWLLSSAKNDALVQSILPTTKFTTEQLAGYMNRNLEALKEFQTRKSDGLNLSDRVWKQTEQFKNELELALDIGLAEGKSADALSRYVRSYLENPDMLFRRVRDARGVLHLSKAAKNYHPGQGVYRSSYKNAQRLTRTEINDAYRSSDHQRWQQLDFIVGFRLRRSNNPYACKLCDSMVGDYPKTFLWRGNHPQCRCVKTSILANKTEISRLTDMILNGDDTSGFKSVNEVKQMPVGFVSWIKDNKQRLLSAKSRPYFVLDNFKDGTITGGLKLDIRGSGLTKTDIKNNGAFEMSDKTSAFLKTERGFNVWGKSENYNNVIKGLDLVTFDSEMNEIAAEKGFEWKNKSLTIYENKVNFNYEGYLNGEEIFLSRDFFNASGKKIVEHAYFAIPKSLQKSGMSKQVFRRLYRQYQNAGINKIKVHANIDVGGYSWARYGFSMTNASDVRSLYGTAKTKLKDRQLKRFLKIYDTYKDTIPFPVRKLATEPFGKDLLLGSDWYGEIDLDIEEEKAYFEQYLFGK